jgi:hypothetical protein
VEFYVRRDATTFPATVPEGVPRALWLRNPADITLCNAIGRGAPVRTLRPGWHIRPGGTAGCETDRGSPWD